jgi:hypothetical protein
LTDVANLFGANGFDNRIYNKAKEKAIEKMLNKLGSDRKVCDLRMDVEQRGKVVIVNLLGSLYEKRSLDEKHRRRSSLYRSQSQRH